MDIISKISIKVKIIILILFFSCSFIVFGLYSHGEISNLLDTAETRKQRFEQILITKNINHINTNIALVAMDSIIDKNSGEISKERLNELDSLFSKFHSLKKGFLDAADTPLEKKILLLLLLL